MKTTSIILALAWFCVCSLPAQVDPGKTGPAGATDGSLRYEEVERDAHSRVWARVSLETNALGEVMTSTNSFVELQTGLHYREGDKWLPSEAKIEILPNNVGAAAARGQHKVIFPLDIQAGLIELALPETDLARRETQWLRSRVWGLAYFDGATGESVLLATVKPSEGQLVGDNTVLYSDAFTDCLADVRYDYTLASFSQDVVIRQQLPDPEKLGLSRNSTRLQVLTEFVTAPAPRKAARPAGGLADQTLGFGSMSMGSGKAFSVAVTGDTTGDVAVAKEWTVLEGLEGVEGGRDFLIEEVPYEAVVDQLQQLPPAEEYKGAGLQRRGKGQNVIAGLQKFLPARYAQAAPRSGNKRIAQVAPTTTPGFVMDYILNLFTSQTNYTFKGDTTYYVSGPVNLSGTNTVFEAGAVIKYAPTNTAKLSISSPITWQGSAYRPVVMTARDDATVGESLPTTNALTGYYADTALYIDADTASADALLANLRVAYAKTAIHIFKRNNHVISHAQFVHCQRALYGDASTISLRNGLMFNVLTNFGGGTFKAEHVTINTANWLKPGATLSLTNSLLVNVTNPGTFTSDAVSTGTASAFVTVGAGSHYLADNTYRNAGTTNINANLAADLKKLTTYGPVGSITGAVSEPITLSPQVARDTDLPDLGYHYAPLDYLCAQVALTTGTVVTLTNGVAVGLYGLYGFRLLENCSIISQGRPEAMNRLAWYPAVQEQPVKINNSSGLGSFFDVNSATSTSTSYTKPLLKLRFTDVAGLGRRQPFFNPAAYYYALNTVSLTDTWLRGVDLTVAGYNWTVIGFPVPVVTLQNNLVERSTVSLFNGYFNSSYQNPLAVNLYNNLFWNTTLTLTYNDYRATTHPAWAVKDNLFDTATIAMTGSYYSSLVIRSNNRFFNTPTGTQLESSPVNLTALTYATGPFGSRYIGTSTPTLVNQGSRLANVAGLGLYHYTMLTSNAKEQNSTVDVGFHYVAADGSGSQPQDTDRDTVPDYFEDPNGNGAYDPGNDNSNWLVADTRLVRNTTRIANPCLECDPNNCTGGSAPILPQSRLECEPVNVVYCQPAPCGPWPQPLPTSSSAGGASLRLDNFYKLTSPPVNVNLPTEHRGFKNTYAIKQWHGVFGFNSYMRGDWPAAFNGNGDCQTPHVRNTPDTTKYRTLTATAKFDGTGSYGGKNTDSRHAIAIRSASVDRFTGKVTSGGSDSDTGDVPAIGLATELLGKGFDSTATLFSAYCARVGLWDDGLYISFTGSGDTRSFSYDDGEFYAEASVNLAAGTFSYHYEHYGSAGPQHSTEDENMTVSATTLHWDHTLSGRAGVPPAEDYTDHLSQFDATLTNPYTSADVNADCDALLAQWNLLDDAEYPWRTDDGLSRGPLVTRNEKVGSLCLTNPITIFDDSHWPGWPAAPKPEHWEETHQKLWIEEGYSNGQPNNPSMLLPWPSQPPGAILGAPLPVHSPNGALYSYEPYFNFYHVNWRFEESERGHPQGFVASRGAFSPSYLPNATQWVDDDQARVWPAGPFWAYGSAWEAEGDHFLFRLKNPYITDTNGEWEQGGYGAFLIKCKWAETIDDGVPTGKDFVFKDWEFNFRDFIGNYYWNANAWYRNEIDIPDREKYNAENNPDDPDLPICGTQSLATAVRYEAFTIAPPSLSAGYYIGSGSYWISEMNCTLQEYRANNRPAIVVQPNPPNPDYNGLFVPMPPAVCDEHFGSLWMGRVDQTTSDTSACANYVANRNNGIANPPHCDPQIELSLIWHPFYDAMGNPVTGRYETFVAPLGFGYGVGPSPHLDLDIDSDNNGGFAPPVRSKFEEWLEDLPTKPGKIVYANCGDSDQDAIPDFADGFDRDGVASNDDNQNGANHFVPVVLELPSGIDWQAAKLTLSYDAADPANVAFSDSVWNAGSGHLRLWRVDGDQDRNKASANAPSDPGDYIAPDTYTDLSRLGLSAANRTVTLYLEGIAPSQTRADQRITVQLDLGATPPADIGVTDSLRVTVIGAEVVEATGDTTVEGRSLVQDSHAAPFFEVESLTVNPVGDPHPSGDGTRLVQTIQLTGRIRSDLCHVIPGAEGKIGSLNDGALQDIVVSLNGEPLPNPTVLAFTQPKSDGTPSFTKPYETYTEFNLVFNEVDVSTGLNWLRLAASDKVESVGLTGFVEYSWTVSATLDPGSAAASAYTQGAQAQSLTGDGPYSGWTYQNSPPTLLTASGRGETHVYYTRLIGPPEVFSELAAQHPDKLAKGPDDRFYVARTTDTPEPYVFTALKKLRPLPPQSPLGMIEEKAGYYYGAGVQAVDDVKALWSFAVFVINYPELQERYFHALTKVSLGLANDQECQLVINVGTKTETVSAAVRMGWNLGVAVAQGEWNKLEAAASGNWQEAFGPSETSRWLAAFMVEALVAINNEYVELSPFERGKIKGRITLEAVLIIVPFTKAAQAGQLTKVGFLTKLEEVQWIRENQALRNILLRVIELAKGKQAVPPVIGLPASELPALRAGAEIGGAGERVSGGIAIKIAADPAAGRRAKAMESLLDELPIAGERTVAARLRTYQNTVVDQLPEIPTAAQYADVLRYSDLRSIKDRKAISHVLVHDADEPGILGRWEGFLPQDWEVGHHWPPKYVQDRFSELGVNIPDLDNAPMQVLTEFEHGKGGTATSIHNLMNNGLFPETPGGLAGYTTPQQLMDELLRFVKNNANEDVKRFAKPLRAWAQEHGIPFTQ